MSYNCYPHYNNNMPPNSPGDFGPGPGMNYGGPPPPGPNGPPPPPSTKQQPSTMEAQYMQQQSQIFVFSTRLANKAAEAVFQQQYPSIIAYHMSQPTTRKFLEKNPFKVNNFGRQFQGNWPPPGKNKKGGGGPPPGDFPPPPQGPNWNTQGKPGYPNYYDGPPYCGQSPGPNGPNQPPGYFGGQQMPSGVKIPDENLTPQQRMHREEQLAKMRKMQALLFPENDHPPGMQDGNCPPMPPPENMDPYNIPVRDKDGFLFNC